MDDTRFCSFCQQTFPDVEYLFRAPDGLAICDGCVQMLAADLETIKAEAVVQPPPASREPPRVVH